MDKQKQSSNQVVVSKNDVSQRKIRCPFCKVMTSAGKDDKGNIVNQCTGCGRGLKTTKF